jgi:hypothetical protein
MYFNFKQAAMAIAQQKAQRGLVMVSQNDGHVCLHDGTVVPVPEGLDRYILILIGPYGEDRIDCTTDEPNGPTWPLDVLYYLQEAGTISDALAMWRAGQLYHPFRTKVMQRFMTKQEVMQQVSPNWYPTAIKRLILESVSATEPEWQDDVSEILRNFIASQLFIKLSSIQAQMKFELLGGQRNDPEIRTHIARIEAYWEN